VIVIDGPLCLGLAVLICGTHALHVRAARRGRRAWQAWWQRYEADAVKRHAAVMQLYSTEEPHDHHT